MDRATIPASSNRIDLSPGSTHAHLSTLKNHGLVEQTERKYEFGLEFIPFREHVRNQSRIYRVGKE